ncbi:MAG: LPS-assembly protein LptD, partial [Bacteroidota bacterium]|nr:LPS-assembly protein LptD [Bacteroidota bacterium]
LGNIITRAQFQQGSQQFESESLEFNFKTQKGLTKNTFTKEGEFFIKANVSKKIGANTVFIKEGYFTTCNLDEPHFAFKTNKMKVISNDIAVSGPTHLEIEGVPIPIYLPFGIYPLSQGRHSGLLAPQFTANQQFGLGLEGLGYYHVLNDYIDVTVRTNIYSYGGWNLNIIPQYRKRYRYNGSFNLAISHTKFNFKGDPDYSLIKTFQINWNHSVDSRARPGTSFSASVNAGSTRHNQYIPNDPYRNFQNQLYSSIAYSKQWQGKPYSLQLSANHNQNNATHLINVILPDAGFTVTTQYPFQRKEMAGTPHWYEKIGVGYSTVARNQISFYDTGHVAISTILDTMQWGAQHRFPINLQLPPLGKFFVNPFFSYEETWYNKRYSRRWDSSAKKVDTITVRKGFFTDRQVNFGVGFNTNIYGLFQFGKNSRIQAIRHVIRPNISFNYKPNISKRSFDVIQVDTFGHRQILPQFEGNLFSPYSYGRFGGLSFGIDNNLEMKVRSKKDTGEAAIKKVTLIDGLSFTSGYNFLDTAFKLQPISINFRTTLFGKLSISANGQLDPYQIGSTGLRINRYVWEGHGFTLGRFTGGSISASTSFQSKPKDESKAANKISSNTITDPSLLGDQQRLKDYMQRNPAEFVDFNIPWSVNLSYSLTLSRLPKPDYSGFTSSVSSSINFNNSFNLTPKWNFSTNGYYDFNTNQLTTFTMSIAREMHCWQMAINVTPIGSFQYFNITLSPKASVLRDLKVNRTRYFYNY